MLIALTAFLSRGVVVHLSAKPTEFFNELIRLHTPLSVCRSAIDVQYLWRTFVRFHDLNALWQHRFDSLFACMFACIFIQEPAS